MVEMTCLNRLDEKNDAHNESMSGYKREMLGNYFFALSLLLSRSDRSLPRAVEVSIK